MKAMVSIIGFMLGMITAFTYVSIDRNFLDGRYKAAQSVKKVVKSNSSPTPTPVSKQIPSAVDNYIRAAFGEDAKTAFEIIRATSKGDCKYKGEKDTHGLFGLHSIHRNRFENGDMYYCYENIDIAKKVFDEEGKGAWGL